MNFQDTSYILRNLNIKINKGEKIGISGRTGSGKSTLLYLMMGLIKPSEGTIFMYGKDVSNHQIYFSEKILKNIDTYRVQ